MPCNATLHARYQHVHLPDEESTGGDCPAFCTVLVGDVMMSAITFAELEYGVAMSANPKRERINLASLAEDIQVVPFDIAASVAYGPIRMATRDSKKDHLDKLIAAHAASLNITIVTNNAKDFAKYPGVVIENWLNSAP